MKASRALSLALVVLQCAVVMTACKKKSPIDPSPDSTISGTIVDGLSNQPIGGATVRVDGVGDATTASNGMFVLDAPGSPATRSLTIESSAAQTRRAWFTVPGSAGTMPLIPASFDLAAFDLVFRANFSSLKRWTTAPALVIQRRTLTFTTVNDPVSVATATTLTDAEVDLLVADFLFALPQLTGSTFTGFASQSTETATPGDIVQVIRTNAIFVARYQGLTAGSGFAGYTRWNWDNAGRVVLGTIMLDQAFDSSGSQFRRSLRSHELGHALSYNHVTSRASVMNPSATVEPNTFDRDGAKLAFQRPPLNASPDSDPNPATISVLATGPGYWGGAP